VCIILWSPLGCSLFEVILGVLDWRVLRIFLLDRAIVCFVPPALRVEDLPLRRTHSSGGFLRPEDPMKK
jgi:hypothetical protein